MSNKIRTRNRKKQANRLSRKQNILLAAFTAVVVLGVAVVFILATGLHEQFIPAITINGNSYKLAVFNYYFGAYYDNFTEEYSEYLEYMFDEDESLKTQDYDEGYSWFEYFVDSTVESMVQVIAVAEAAEDAGFTLPDDYVDEIAENMEAVDYYAESLGISTNNYLAKFYGTGITRALYEKQMTLSRMAAAYSEYYEESIAPAEDEIQEYYESNIEYYTTVTYERFYVKAAGIGETATEEERAEAQELAEVIADRVEAGESLSDLGEEYDDYGTYYSFEDTDYVDGSSYGEWLFSDEREDGDLNVIDDGNGYYVMIFHSSAVVEDALENAEEDLIQEIYDAWLDEVTESAVYTRYEFILNNAGGGWVS